MSDIQYAYPLILNKVASPRYATPTLRRGRLIEWLNAAANCRAIVVSADAGYGKTTLLWQWSQQAAFPTYWYKLDRTDRDWTFHIGYLIEAISSTHEGFGRRAHSMLRQMQSPASSRAGVTAYLLAEMHERLTEPCTFIIDDWQYVNAVTEVRGLWNQILRDAPPSCRFVFASRVKPRLQFARFKTHGGYAELRAESLRFSESEIADLFRETYGDPLEPADVAEVERRTEGWAVSLQLLEVSLRERASREERRRFIRSMPDTSDSDLFDFLAEEVLDQQPADTRNFLLSTSILQQMTAEVAERLAGVHDGQRELNDLEQRGLFTSRLDDERYRYHNLFREFLERRLTAERAPEEVAALHIHAASYFETTAQWPEAIHHYLRASLHRQAARLIARYGENVIEEGRLGLVDEWIQLLPTRAIRENARLSLLHGETCGIRGDWEAALAALNRARSYFARKGDRRLEALACLKLSSIFSNYGDVERSAAAAESGLSLVPTDDVATRLRLEGNLAITRTLLTEPYDTVIAECQRVAAEATSRGFEHFAAVAHHNMGTVYLRMGRVPEAVAALESASRFWSTPPTSPFADNAELAGALVAAGDLTKARLAAEEGMRRTVPWTLPHLDALFGLAGVHLADGRFSEAIRILAPTTATPSILGIEHGLTHARLIEACFLSGQPGQITSIADRLLSRPPDPRYLGDVAPALAIARHVAGDCNGECLDYLHAIEEVRRRGATALAAVGRVKLGVLALEHGGPKNVRFAWDAVDDALSMDLGGLRWWLRQYAPFAKSVMKRKSGVHTLCLAADCDPEGWRTAMHDALSVAGPDARRRLLPSVIKHANGQTVAALRLVSGADVVEARRRLIHAQASRLYLRTFGGISIHRGDWAGPELQIEKRRARSLLAVLAAHLGGNLTRDMALDLLWPDADADSALNSLNQTVFQLRRYIDPNYRVGDSPEYIVSSSEHVALNPELVIADIDELRGLPARMAVLSWDQRQALARRTIELIRGEFLADVRYESWVGSRQLAVHTEVRRILMPIARTPTGDVATDVAIQAAAALMEFDPWDEEATLAMADCLARGGQRVAARDLVLSFANRIRAELDAPASTEFLRRADQFRVGGV